MRAKVKVQIITSEKFHPKFDSITTDLRGMKGNVDEMATMITRARLTGSTEALKFQVTSSFLNRPEVKKVLDAKADWNVVEWTPDFSVRS